ncbi:MAG: YgjV family protein [Firmicutes bacterium]|nr:YgjV family protein [Bacillota bacterium]
MFNFENVGLPTWIISQIFAVFALVMIVLSMQAKTKIRTMIFLMVFNALMIVSTALLSQWLIVGISALAIIRDILFIWREKYYPNNRGAALVTLFYILSISIILSYLTIDWSWPTLHLVNAIILQLFSMFFIFGAWKKGVHFIKISRFFLAISALIYHIIFQNYTAVIIEIFCICSIIVFYIRFMVSKRKERNELSKDIGNESNIEIQIEAQIE